MNHQTVSTSAKTQSSPAFNLDRDSVRRGVNERIRLLAVQHEFSPIKAMRLCVRTLLNGSNVFVRGRGTNLSLSGVFLCRNPLCMYCSAKRSMESADTLSKGLLQAKKRGFFIRLLTLTIPSGGYYRHQRALLKGAQRRFAQAVSQQFKKQGAQESGLSWSLDFTAKPQRGHWCSHLHLHAVVVSDRGSLSESKLFSLWQTAVSNEAGHPVTLSRHAFYARVPHSEKSVSRYVLGKFLASAVEVQASALKGGGKVGGGLGWREFVRYIHATGDLDAVALFRDVLQANKNKWWSSVGQTIKRLAHEFEEEEQAADESEGLGQAEEVEVEVYARDWQVLGKIDGGIARFLAVFQRREDHPDEFERLCRVTERLKQSHWLSDTDVELVLRSALSL